MATTQPCAGAVILDQSRRLLVIRRAHDPSAGKWSIPGGRCRPGEDPATACVREVREETGLVVDIVRLAGEVTLSGAGGVTYRVHDYECVVTGGVLAAGDDATDVRWADLAEVRALDCAPGLLAHLEEWGLAPA